MAPVKFDDIPKVANEVLNDDYQTSGHQLKAKMKTKLGGAVATTAVDLFVKDAVTTPAKITWKLPKPFGIAGVSVDKLEMDKAGKFKMEATADASAHRINDLKVEAKSDLANPNKATLGCTFTGLKSTQVKFETTPLAPKNFTLEATRTIQQATLGIKCGMSNLTMPDVGLRMQSGPFFCAAIAKAKAGVLTAAACYKASADLKVAGTCSYEHAGKKLASYSVGLAYAVQPGTSIKAKLQQDMSVSCGVKHDLAKGFTILSGFKYGTKDGKQSFGCQVSIE